MAFEKFERKKSGVFFPAVTITKSGSLSINTACMKEHKIHASHAELYFDPEGFQLGIKPCEDGVDAFPLCRSRHKERSGSEINAYIAAKRFLKYYNIDFEEKSQYSPTWDDKTKMLVLNLNEELIPRSPKHIGHGKDSGKPSTSKDIKL